MCHLEGGVHKEGGAEAAVESGDTLLGINCADAVKRTFVGTAGHLQTMLHNCNKPELYTVDTNRLRTT